MDNDAPSWTIERLEPQCALLITTRGRFDAATFSAMILELVQATPVGYTRFVFDHRDWRIQLTTSEIYALPDALERMGWTRAMRVAVVIAEKSRGTEDFHFFANIAIGRAYAYSVFTDLESALAWVAAGD